ncbi:MAG: hypothetical protein DRI94_04785 [Bacteroidetes bacterium]|nr:MAG: hypothetical protein DRI94_04785 [Bacteroidota bacterium]
MKYTYFKYLFIPILFLFANASAQNIDSLKQITLSLKYSEKGHVLYQIGNYYIKKNEIDSSLKYTLQSVKYLNSDTEQSNAYENLGMCYYYRNDFSKALRNFKQSLKYSLETGNDSIIARRYSDLGVVYDYLGAYDKAVENYLNAVKLFEKRNDLYGIAKTYNNLGIINETFDKYETALDYYNKSLRLKQTLKLDSSEFVSNLVNLGSVYEKSGYKTKALQYYKEASELFRKTKNNKYTALCLNNIAEIYVSEKEFEKAKHYLTLALNLSSEKSGNMNFAKSNLILANVLISRHDFKNAELNLNKAFKTAEDVGLNTMKSDILKGYINLYEAEKNYKNAFETQKKYLRLKDSINTEKLNEKTEHLQIVYETEKKEQKIQNLKTDISRKRILWISVFIILLMVLVLVYFVLRNKLNKSKINNYIFNQKLLRSQMNPHFIFNALNSVQSYMLENDTKKAGFYLSSFSKLMRSVLTNSREEFISLQEELDTLENYLKIQKLRYYDKFDYKIEVDENLDTDFYLIPPMLAQPFIENALVHGFKDIDYEGFISVSFKLEDNMLKLFIEDNGKGISYDAEKKHKSYATEITKERLKILKQQTKTNIKFEIFNLKDTSKTSGTQVIIILPQIKNTENV